MRTATKRTSSPDPLGSAGCVGSSRLCILLWALRDHCMFKKNAPQLRAMVAPALALGHGHGIGLCLDRGRGPGD